MIIGIGGGTGSGKTTVARKLRQRLGQENVALIAQDSYYVDRSHLQVEERELINYDHPDSFDQYLLEEHLRRLRQRRTIHVPIYDYTTHTRQRETVTVQPRPVVIVEGILVLADPRLRSLFDLKVFVDTDPDVRILRRVARDLTERGRDIGTVQKQYLETVKPMHEAFVEPSKRHADIILPEGGNNPTALNLLTSWIERNFHQEDLSDLKPR